MQLAKPKGEAAAALPPFENPRGLPVGKEPVTMKAGMVIQVSDNPEEIGVSENTQQQISSVDELAVQAPQSILSCLHKFHTEAKMNSSQSAGSGEELSSLNAQLANLRVKKLLQIADNIRNDNDIAFTATRSCLDADAGVATQDMKT